MKQKSFFFANCAAPKRGIFFALRRRGAGNEPLQCGHSVLKGMLQAGYNFCVLFCKHRANNYLLKPLWTQEVKWGNWGGGSKIDLRGMLFCF